MTIWEGLDKGKIKDFRSVGWFIADAPRILFLRALLV